MGTIGFSYVGLIYLLMLFIPNIIWSKKQPEGYAELAKNENKILLVFERVGQVAVVITVIMFSNYNPTAFSAWTAWLIISFALMIVYEIAWLRYFVKPSIRTFYGRLFFVPIPLASMPVFAFLFLGIYGKVIWLIFSVILLGIGHIGIHIQHSKVLIKN